MSISKLILFLALRNVSDYSRNVIRNERLYQKQISKGGTYIGKFDQK